MKSIIKNLFLIFLSFLILAIIFAGYKLYNRIKIANERIFKLEQLEPSYQEDKKLNKLEIEKIYLTELSRVRINNNNFRFKKFQLNQEFMLPTGYVEIYENNIFFVSGNGNIYYEKLSDFYNYSNEDKLSLKKVESNLIEFSGVNLLNSYGGDGYFSSMFVRDILIDDGEIFLVCNFYQRIENKVYVKPSILKAKIDLDNNLEFDFFFKTNEHKLYFILENNKIIDIDENIDFRHSGGRIQKYKNDKFLYAIPDYGLLDRVEDLESIYGKILIVDRKNDYEIFSYGHRNQQGLYYDFENDKILSTEHGPSGGDEINLIKKGKGYGWPKVSKGKGYTDPDHVISKNHEVNGYEEPIFYWKTNPGISQILKVPSNNKVEEFDRAFRSNSYIAASLMGSEEWAGRSLWNFKLDKKNKVKNMNQIFINDRIRDFVYDKNNEKIILVLENQISLGVIDTLKINNLHNSF